LSRFFYLLDRYLSNILAQLLHSISYYLKLTRFNQAARHAITLW